MKKFASIAAICLAGALLVPALSAAQSVDPGDMVDLTDTGAALCDSNTSLNPDEEGVSAQADCDVVENFLIAGAFIDGVTMLAAEATATSWLEYDFIVSADMDTEDNLLAATLMYDVDWVGVKLATKDAQATVDINLSVVDVTDGANSVIAEAIVHADGIGRDLCDDSSCLNTPVDDMDSRMDTLVLGLLRGHNYVVRVELHVRAASDEVEDIVDALSNYTKDQGAGDSGGALVSKLLLSAGVDVAALVEQVEKNTEDIADNADDIADNADDIDQNADDIADNKAAIAALGMQVGDMQKQIDEILAALEDLTSDLQNHTHIYLTGRGNGHNNTEATSSSANLPDDDDGPSTDPVSDSARIKGRAYGRTK